MNDVLYKQDYDKDYANDLLAKNKYQDLISYLRKFQMPNETEQNQLDSKIKSLQTTATIYNGILNRAEDKDAVEFAMGMSNGSINSNTSIGKKYANIVNDLGSTNKQRATKLKVTFENDDYYSNFLSSLGNSEDDLYKNNIKISQDNNGRHTLTISKSNIYLTNVIRSLNNIRPSRVDYAIHTLGVAGANQLGSTVNSEYVSNIMGFNVIGVDKFNNDIKNEHIPIHKLNRLTTLVDYANNKYTDAKAGYKFKPIVSELISSDFKGAMHQRLIGDLNSGELGRTDFEYLDKKLDESYRTRIAQTSLGKYKVYLDTGGGNFELTSDEDKEYLEVKIREAILRDSDTKYSAAMSGNQFGTLITIPAKAQNKDKSFPEQGNLKNLNTDAQYRVFIPNLFNDDAESSFNRDSQTRAMKQYHLLKTNNGTQYLNNGDIIRNVDNNGGIMHNNNTGKDYQVNIDYILKRLDEEYLTDDAIRHYKREISKLNDDTKLKFNDPNGSFTIGNTKTLDDIGREIAQKCLIMATELEEDVNSPKYLDKAYQLYLNITKGIGYTGNEFLEVIKENNRQ